MEFKIVTFPNPILNQRCREVLETDIPLLHQLIPELFKVCFKSKRRAVGMAANQLGHPLRLFILNYLNTNRTFINPEIKSISEETNIHEEGCLSFNKSVYYPIERHNKVELEYLSLSSNGSCFIHKSEAFEGYQARVIQHEMDHINGITMFNKWKEQNHL